MVTFLHFALIGLGLGALYALPAQGLILVYRGSGIINLAQGAIGIGGAYVAWALQYQHHQNVVVSIIAGIGFAVVIGIFMQNVIMRRLRTATPMIRLASTLGVLLALEALANIFYPATYVVPSYFPVVVWNLGDGITITNTVMYVLFLSILMTVALWWLYRFTRFGRSTNAVAENPLVAASVGIRTNRIATINWALGCGLAAVAGILVVTTQTLAVSDMDVLLLPMLAAALVGGFRSFPWTLAGGLLIGVLQAELTLHFTVPGLSDSIPFVIIVITLVIRGGGLPQRDQLIQKLPLVGTGRLRPSVIGVALAVAVLVALITPVLWVTALTQSATGALILLSIVVITGYAGQLSLAQAAIAGFGGWMAATMSIHLNLPFLVCLLIGVAASIPLALVFGYTATRTRGLNLAIASLGLGAAIEYLLLDNVTLTGGEFGLSVHAPSIFGLSINPIFHYRQYAILCIIVLALACVAVANLRRGRVGRRLLATRSNERAAEALGINVRASKMFAFGTASAIAALGGVLMAYQNTTVNLSSFTTFFSITLIAYVLIMSVGLISGALLGSFLIAGGIGTQMINSIFGANLSTGNLPNYIALFGGCFLIVQVFQDPDGVAAMNVKLVQRLSSKILTRHIEPAPESRNFGPAATVERVPASSLEFNALSVNYGGVKALQDVSFRVEAGMIVGLIGPNGAGKTTLIDAATGFARCGVGSVVLNGSDVTGWAPHKRARAGLARSFQSLELFDDLTVLENLQLSLDEHDRISYVRDFVYPRKIGFSQPAERLLRELGVDEVLNQNAGSLPQGVRRVLGIARAVLAMPGIILLDEPAAGLSDSEGRELSLTIRSLAKDYGMGVLLVEHDVDFVMGLCDEVVVLDFGKVICSGLPAMVRQDSKVVAAYLGEPIEESKANPVDSDEKMIEKTTGVGA
jgi:ABC-type branched-subunit amino acid transport system ATPase component/branched-subunit amino acid ABC-type transport system permease component